MVIITGLTVHWLYLGQRRVEGASLCITARLWCRKSLYDCHRYDINPLSTTVPSAQRAEDIKGTVTELTATAGHLVLQKVLRTGKDVYGETQRASAATHYRGVGSHM